MNETGNYHVKGKVTFYVNNEFYSSFEFITKQQRTKAIDSFLLKFRGSEVKKVSWYVIEIEEETIGKIITNEYKHAAPTRVYKKSNLIKSY